MRAQIFLGQSTTEALEKVREAFGADAVVLAIRDKETGVEITAMAALQGPPDGFARRRSDFETNSNNKSQSVEPDIRHLVTDLKALLKNNIAPSSWDQIRRGSTQQAECLRVLLQAGFSTQLCGEFTDIVKSELTTSPDTSFLPELKRIIANRLSILDPFKVFDEGGLFPLFGVTGVGKTTLLAKIVTRCVLRYGRENIAILTTDNFRIGARDQLETYSKIIDVPITTIRSSDDLEFHLNQVRTKKVLMVDTAGLSQRDLSLIEQVSLLSSQIPTAKPILVLSATLSRNSIEDVVLTYKRALSERGGRIHSVVITKTDEAAQLGPVIDCVIRHGMPLLFLTNGQRVPEDLSFPDPGYLADRALEPRSQREDLKIDDHVVPAYLSDHLIQWKI